MIGSSSTCVNPRSRHVVAELLGQLAVGEALAPRAEVHLVDRDRLAASGSRRRRARASHCSSRHSCRDRNDDRRRLRRHLGRLRDRVGVQADRAVGAAQLELVAGALAHAWQEELPDARAAERPHRVQAAVPEVEVADDADRARGRRPDGERGAA